MTRYVLSPRAQADLSDIWDYTADRWGAAQAETYIRHLRASIEAVAAAPQLGTACNDIRTGYYKYPSAEHLPAALCVRGPNITRARIEGSNGSSSARMAISARSEELTPMPARRFEQPEEKERPGWAKILK